MQRMLSVSVLAAAVLLSGCSQNVMQGGGRGGSIDKSYDTKLIEERAALSSKFQKLTFSDPVNGNQMSYNLFVPDNYDSSKSYPLVVFMADGSTTGKGIESPLIQGWGGIIWASDQEQAKHESFVLVPAFVGPENVVNDRSEVTDEVDTAMRLLNAVKSQYTIDSDRLYTTGQSMGGMISFYWNATYPDLFAASLYVGSQWDINVLQPQRKQKFSYVVSAGDKKASAGMTSLKADFEKYGVEFGQTKFSAKLSQTEQNREVSELIEKGYDRNFIQFDANTVTPDGVSGGGAEHMYSFDYAYKLEPVRDWLFEQSK
ncbi:alpha/beta hydrolase-fold protein [Marinomonas ostreistagni]|uniref:Esterase n=1 Tax=Marinomonas ostreistagni TaxID=359209 RepID=A0ABS0Z8P5_9GAMM|nr:alpha/beta hydrolase-fold protein [Marinomonas ostreistagni]MBJ7550027.1 hypothetical protein [Marinomonas ostreistagni]